MTRKDFNLIAAAIKDGMDYRVLTEEEKRGIEIAARELARALRSTNPRFDYDRFITACGFDD